MAVTKLTTNLNNHQSLPDKPTLTAQELKILFDKASNDIKDYINNILTEQIDSLYNNSVKKTEILTSYVSGGNQSVVSAEVIKVLANSIDTRFNQLGNGANLTVDSGTQTPIEANSTADIYFQYME